MLITVPELLVNQRLPLYPESGVFIFLSLPRPFFVFSEVASINLNNHTAPPLFCWFRLRYALSFFTNMITILSVLMISKITYKIIVFHVQEYKKKVFSSERSRELLESFYTSTFAHNIGKHQSYNSQSQEKNCHSS